jgi:hypothetical protein
MVVPQPVSTWTAADFPVADKELKVVAGKVVGALLCMARTCCTGLIAVEGDMCMFM